MKFKGFYTAMTAMSLVAAPTIAAAAPIATPLTQPATESVDGDSALRGGRGGGFVIAIIALAAVIAGIIIIVKEDDKPNSP